MLIDDANVALLEHRVGRLRPIVATRGGEAQLKALSGLLGAVHGLRTIADGDPTAPPDLVESVHRKAEELLPGILASLVMLEVWADVVRPETTVRPNRAQRRARQRRRR